MGNLYLLYSCNEWCEKSKASLLLVTSDKETLYAAIGGEILTGNVEYDGETGGNGFLSYKWDYLNKNVDTNKLQYGFINEIDEALLSEQLFLNITRTQVSFSMFTLILTPPRLTRRTIMMRIKPAWIAVTNLMMNTITKYNGKMR